MEGLFNGFTPVRRREDTIATRRISFDEGKSWTTARCNRLLRPLISRVAALRRLSPSENSALEKSALPHRTKYDSAKEEDSAREDDKDDGDDEWAPVKKKLKRTYSARLGKSTRGRPPKVNKSQAYSDIRHRMPFLVPGEISVPTPILNRTKGGPELEAGRSGSYQENMGNENLDTRRHRRPPKSRYLTKDGEAHFQLSEILRELRRSTDSSRYTLYEGIYNSLEALLKATMADVDPNMRDRTGVRSLFNTCLRRVPEVIKEEEELFALEAGERSAMEVNDISSEIYTELEALGHGDRGWKHLRSIVRAHGVQIVGDAITQGLLRSDFVRALVLLCVHTACLDEAEELLSCLLKATTYSEPNSTHSRTSDESSMVPISVLEKFASYTGRRAFQVRELAGLFSTEQLPLAWLATKQLCSVWTYVIHSSASDPDSSNFLTTLLPRLCSKTLNYASSEGIMLRALDATFASVLTALSAITLLDSPNDNEIPSDISKWYKHPGSVLQQCFIACSALPIPLNEHRSTLLAFSELLTSPELGTSSSLKRPDLFWGVSKLLSFRTTQKSVDNIASFVCSVACCCGRGASNSGFEYLKLLHSRLRKYLKSPVCSNKGMIIEVLIDSAFSFARRHDDCEHLDYAEDIESEYHEEHMALEIPRRLSTNISIDVSAGFRWEEGISEWVTATPALTLKKRAVIPDSEDDSADELDSSDSPLRHNTRRGARLTAPRTFPHVTRNQGKLSTKQEKSKAVIPYRRRSLPQKSLDTPSESEEDPLLTTLDVSMTSMTETTINNSSFSSSQSTEEGGNPGGGRVLRPRRGHGLRGQAFASRQTEDSDDELSSSTTSWDALIRRNKIAVVVFSGTNTANATEKEEAGNIHNRYPIRRKSANSAVSTNIIPRKRAIFEIDDSEDELCL